MSVSPKLMVPDDGENTGGNCMPIVLGMIHVATGKHKSLT